MDDLMGGYLSLPTDRCTTCQCERWKHKKWPNSKHRDGSCTRCGPATCKQFDRGKGKDKKRIPKQEAA